MNNGSLKHFDSLILVAGISGAGKSSAMALLKDSGYFVVDNLPVPLLPTYLTFSSSGGVRFSRTALLLDIDSRESRMQLLRYLAELAKESGSRPRNLKIVFLDADTQAVIRRYSETRRPHPGFDPSRDKTLDDTILRERARLQPIKETADLIVDTSNFNIHALKRELRGFLLSLGSAGERFMRVNFLSFGFKYGVPLDCDLIVDVRFLRNPHFVETLREQTGLNAEVAEYVFGSPDAQEFVERYTSLLDFLLPRYQFEGKAYLNVGVGCTGGKHRSVAIAMALSKQLDDAKYHVSVKHRDISR